MGPVPRGGVGFAPLTLFEKFQLQVAVPLVPDCIGIEVGATTVVPVPLTFVLLPKSSMIGKTHSPAA